MHRSYLTLRGIATPLHFSPPESFYLEKIDSPSIAAIALFDTTGNQTTCTGFLVTDTIMMTSAHCLPLDLRFQDMPCQGRIFAYFSATGNTADRFSCKRIVTGSLLDGILSKNDSDYVFLELETSPGRPSLTLGTEGFQDQQSYTTHRIFLKSDDIRTGRHTTTLTAQLKSIITGNLSPIDSTVAMTGDAELRDVGAPILNKAGHAIGLIQALHPIEKMHQWLTTKLLLPKFADMEPLLFATNFASLPALPKTPTPITMIFTPHTKAHQVDNIMKNTIQNLQLDKTFIWEEHTYNHQTTLHTYARMITPKCIIPGHTPSEITTYVVTITYETTTNWRCTKTPHITALVYKVLGPLTEGSVLLAPPTGQGVIIVPQCHRIK